jgi:hypothetical protein
VIVLLIEHLLKDQQPYSEHFIFLKTYEWAQWASGLVPCKLFQPCADVDKSTFISFSFVSAALLDHPELIEQIILLFLALKPILNI